MRVLGLICCLLLLTMGLAQAADTIKVGFVDDFSGRASENSKAGIRGWRIVVDEFNARGGLHGRKIETILGDDKFDPKLSPVVAERLIEENKVDFLAGTSNSDCALAVSEVAKKHKKVFIIHVSRTSKATNELGHDYVFRACYNTEIEGRSGAKYAVHKGYRQWFIVGEDYGFGRAFMSTLWSSLQKLNPNVQKVGEIWVKLGTKDYEPVIREIMEKKPSAVAAAFGSSGKIAFTKQAKQAGLFDKTSVFMTQMADASTIQALEGDIPLRRAFGSAAYLSYYPKTEANKSFVQKYAELAKADGQTEPCLPNYTAFHGYCCAKFLTEAIIKAQSTETHKVMNALKGLTVDTPVGPMTIRACDNQAMAPVFWGELRKLEGFTQPVIDPPYVVGAEQVMSSCDEVLGSRK
ncbi:MAG: ABC transporter substrate-binding protein [Thermodesulfobacteriota bacterium]